MTTPDQPPDLPSTPFPVEALRGGRLQLADLTGLEIRDCEVGGLKIVDCYGGEVSLGGDFTRVVVNDVDVSGYVEGELDRRHPERVAAREASTPEQYRAAWTLLQSRWDATIERARRLPEERLHESVDGEFSFVQTLRHLLFAADAWLGNAVLAEASPYHPLGLPAGGTPDTDAASVGLTVTATPTFDEVLAARRTRTMIMRGTVDRLDETELDRVCGRPPAEFYPEREYVVRSCLKVVLKEEAEHHRYATRDLAVLEGSAAPPS